MNSLPSRLLRYALRANASFSAVSAALFLAASGSVAAFLNFIPQKQVLLLGLQLAVFAFWLFRLSARSNPPNWQVWLIIALDVLWVAGSFQILLVPPPGLTQGGKWAIGIVADIVSVFALLQFAGLRKLRKHAVAPTG